MLERSENARNRTELSLTLAKEAFGNATEIVETLENFDDKLKENKEAADKEWNLEPEAKSNLELAGNLSLTINNKLYPIRTNLSEAARFLDETQVDLRRVNQASFRLLCLFSLTIFQ